MSYDFDDFGFERCDCAEHERQLVKIDRTTYGCLRCNGLFEFSDDKDCECAHPHLVQISPGGYGCLRCRGLRIDTLEMLAYLVRNGAHVMIV